MRVHALPVVMCLLGLAACQRTRPDTTGSLVSSSADSRTIIDGDSLKVVLTAQSAPMAVRLSATVHNVSRRPIHLEWGDCSFSFSLYRKKARDGSPAYEWSRRPEPPGTERVCLAYLRTLDLAPGDSLAPREFEVTERTSRILGDSLPAGRYYANMSLRFVNPANRRLPRILQFAGPELSVLAPK